MQYERLIRVLTRGIREGSLDLTLPNGHRLTVGYDLPGPAAEVTLHRWRALRRLAFGGGVGFAEAYIDGDWETPDLAAVIELAARNQDLSREATQPNPMARAFHWVRHALRPNTRSGSRRNISRHYDLGNEFYRQWLDPTMTYSSAIFSGVGEGLDEAQRNKYRRLLDAIRPERDEHLLEIGCGWGGFAILAAKERGVRVTGITLSREQHALASERVFKEGLADRVRIEMRDYRDVAERYDHVASIEMFEAVGEAYWPAFFGKVGDTLKAGGRAAMQIITIDDSQFERYRRGADFIQTYIFPGGMLPSPSALRREVAAARLAWVGDAGFGPHYARTLAAWRVRFESAWDDIEELGFDDRFRRMWRFYLAYCEGGFRAGSIDVKQIVLAKG